MAAVKRISPPPCCWSCGQNLPEKDFDAFHEQCDSDKGQQLVLDEMKYPLACCRRMFLGDNPEYRRIMALYDMGTINEAPHL